MKIKLLVVVYWLVALTATGQVASTPPYVGPDLTNQNEGTGLDRLGFVHRYENWVYPPNVLAEWEKKRGFVDPSSVPGLLSNPLRADGTSLNFGLGIPSDFTGHVPIFTRGNRWPYVGVSQGDPLTYDNLETDVGLYFQNGQVVATQEPLLVDGIDRVTVVNNTGYSYLISAGVFPGNEQPGQVMTIVDANGNAQLPIPPRDWWVRSTDGTSLVPEVYASVAGLNPLDAPGWKNSSYSTLYEGGNQPQDFGTGGFAYTFGSLFGRNNGGFDLTQTLFAGFHTNEGYDPLVSGDPGYGAAFYIDGQLEAVMDIQTTGSHTADAVMVAHNGNNPNAAQGGLILSSIIGVQPGEIAELHFVTHEAAQDLIRQYETNGSWTKVTKVYQSNTLANVTNVPLPPIIPADGGAATPTCTDGIQNGNETGVDCGGSCTACTTAATCTDGVQNGDETGVDCGGSCTACSTPDPAPTCTDGVQNGDETGIDCGGSCAACTTGGSGTCGDFGVSYVDDNTVRVYHRDENWTNPTNIFACIADNCYAPTLQDGYYFFDFSSASTFGFVQPVLNQALDVEFKLNHSGNAFFTTGTQTFTFTTASCSFTGSAPAPTCTDGVQNGDETGVDCGGACTACSTPDPAPTCTDGVQNGDETGIDCGGSCSACSQGDSSGGSTPNTNLAFLEPTNGDKLLFIGQDLGSVSNYGTGCASCPTVGGVATYVNIAEVLNDQGLNGALGWGTNDQPNGQDLDWGGGPLNAHSAATGWPNSAVQIGLYMVGNEGNVASGSMDAHIEQLGDFFNALSSTAFYLRIGYEFDGNWNGYNAAQYQDAYRRIVDRLRAMNVSNVAYVWQSSTSPIDDILDGGREDLMAFYPGDTYVDWMAMSWFLPPNEQATVGNTPSTQLFLADELVGLARQRNKPVMIAEATPQGYDISDLTNRNISSVWDGDAGLGLVNKTATQIWDEWFVPYFNFINNNDDVIKAVTYINANWDVQGLWDSPYEQGYWGDTRIESNATIQSNWVNTITQAGWLHGRSDLNNFLHGMTGDSTVTATCTDGIQNGDETGVDCGGSCTACEPAPTCTDGVQNGDETGVDCGGSCTACEPAPTCTDGVQNGDETGVDCGGSCTACEAAPTCTDGIQNGDETGVDCGGSCTACTSPADHNINEVQAKLLPSSGILLGIGQDVTSIAAFDGGVMQNPAIVSGYTSVNNVEGIDVEASYGTGPQHLAQLVADHPNSAVQVGVFLVDQLQDINNGTFDSNMNSLLNKLDSLDRPIYMRWGYEFDNPDNNYDTTAYVDAWVKMHDLISTRGLADKIAMVWHSGAFCGSTLNNYPVTSWYPGSTYVDYMAVSVYTPGDCNYEAQDEIVTFARQEGKPVLISESTPQGYDLSDNTVAPLIGANAGVKTSITAQQIWDEWYHPYFDYISKNRDVIRGIVYINADWDSQGLWGAPYDNFYWGDSRVEANSLIESNWLSYTDSTHWVKGDAGLLDSLGYTFNTTQPAPTCTDGVQNGDETGVDCGGSCTACTPDPTCTDGVQNGDETGVDCGGSCTACTPDPTCTDGVQNGDETGVDCGGSCTACTPDPTCTDGIQNGDETGVDCGGSACAACDAPTVSRFEAESGSLNGTAMVYIDTAASGGEGVAYLHLLNNGFTLSNVPASSRLDLRYASENSGTISVRVNSGSAQKVNFSPTGGFTGSYAIVGLDVTIPANASVTVFNDNGDQSMNVDYVEFSSSAGGSTPAPTASCTDGVQNGDETGVDCGGSCTACAGGSNLCGEFGISYIDDNTARVYHRDQNWVNPRDIKVCMGSSQSCFDALLLDGYYYFDFNSTTSFSFVNPVLNQSYTIEFKLNHDNGFFTSGEQTVTFTTDQCSFTNAGARGVSSLLSETEEQTFSIYPNPVQETLFIESTEPVSFKVFSLFGQNVLSGQGSQIDVSSLQAGTYILMLKDQRTMFIKQ